MKGVAEVLEYIMVLGVGGVVIAGVFLWSVPLLQKTKDVSSLTTAEQFMNDLADKIIAISNNPGREELPIPTMNFPGTLYFDGTSFRLVVATQGTIYSTEGEIPLGKNDCSSDSGNWGGQDYATLCVSSRKIAESYETTYTLKFIQLNTEGIDSYKTTMTGAANSGGEGHVVTVDNRGTAVQNSGGRRIRTTTIAVSI